MADRLRRLLGQLRRLDPRLDSEADAALLDRFVRQRDEAAFEALVGRHGSMVLGVCRRVLRDAHDAEDVFQAAFLILARKAAAVRSVASLSAWLHTVAHSLALKHLQAEGRRKQREARSVQAATTAPQPDPLDQMSARELLQMLDEELRRLPKAYRLPLILCYLEGRTQDEAARLLGWTPSSVRGRLQRGRTRLHARLVRRGLVLGTELLAAAALRGETAVVVSPELTRTTVQSALCFAAGRGTVGASMSSKATVLAERVIHNMLMTKVKIVSVLLGMALCLGGGGVLAYQTLRENVVGPPQPADKPRGEAEPTRQPDPGQRAAVRVDYYGDQLPEGALARLGTMRLRHSALIDSVAFSLDGKTVASGGQDGTVRLWDAATGKEVHTLRGHQQRVSSVAFSPDGKTVVSGGGFTVRLWEAATGKEIRTLQGHQLPVRCVAFSRDGKTVASGGDDNTVRLWEAATGKEIRTLGGKQLMAVRSVAFSSDSKTVASGGDDNTVRLWEVATGKEVRNLKRHQSSVMSIAFSSDGRMMVSGGADKMVCLWETATGKKIRILNGHQGGVSSVAFSPDGKTVASVGGTVRLWEAATGKEIRRLRGHFNGRISGVAFSSDGKTVVSGVGCTVCLWEAATGKEIRRLQGHQGQVSSVAFSSDGKMVASVADDSTVRLWEMATGKEIRILKGGASSVAFSPDGKTVASGDGSTVRLWEAATGKEIRNLKGHRGAICSVAFSSDGKTVVSGSIDNTVRLWEVATGKEIRTLGGYLLELWTVAFSPDGKTVASLRLADGTVRLWEATTGKEIRTLQGHEMVFSVAFSSDSKTVASGEMDGIVRLWEVATGKEIRTLKGHQEGVHSVAFSPGGRIVAATSGNRVQLWDLLSGNQLPPLVGHRGNVLGLTFSPDGRALASVSADTTGLVWDLTCGAARPETKQGPDALKALWADLASPDTVRARRAVWTLVAVPSDQSVSLLRDHLRPAAAPDTKQLARLISDLDAADLKVRQKASQELEKLGPYAESALRKGLEGSPSVEMRKRLEQLLETVTHSGEVFRILRAMEVLEQIGTPEARQLLKTLAADAPGPRLRQEVQASLDRLDRAKRP